MKQHPSWEAWSEWVDGESRNPETMRRHLQECPACAAQVKSIETMTADLHRLPELDVHPAFVTRVMARAAETASQPPVWWHRIVSPLALAAFVLILAAGLGPWRVMPRDSRTPNDVDSPTIRYLAEAMLGYDEAAHDGEVWDMPLADSMTPDELVEGAVQTEAFASMASAYDDETDLDGLVAALDDGEIEAFHGLVRAYAEENESL